MLQNARVTAFTVSELLRENQLEGGGYNYPPPLFHTHIHTPIRDKKIADITLKDRLENIFRNNNFQYRYISKPCSHIIITQLRC